MPINIPVIDIYIYCQDQVIMGPEGPVALNLLAVEQAMTSFKVPEDERMEFSFDVRYVASSIFAEQSKDRQEKLKRAQKQK